MASRKIGVLTFHRSVNYGSYWQARCLVEGLRRRGHEAELLDHDCPCVRRAEARCALQPELPRRTPRRLFASYAAKARRMADAASRLPLSRRFSLHEPQAARGYDAIVVGSDEVWNFRHPWYGSKPIFFGDGLGTDRLVSYAASFGNHSAWDGIDTAWAHRLGRFAALSVRDENSRHLVRGGTGRDPLVVLDPCLQFPEFARAAGIPTGDYALVYGHSFPAWLRTKVRAWADRRGLRLVSIGYRNEWTDDQRIAAGPHEFVRAVAGARAVVTNFFHGCVFSLLNGKPWVSWASEYRAIKIPDLTTLLGAEYRLLDEHMPDYTLAELLETPVQPRVTDRLAALRAQSDAFLDAALA